ncbi:MAG: acetate--CoA ligase [Methanocellales archaeon]|nr:acetate--CoA ligase [Methanocellales archaeon]
MQKEIKSMIEDERVFYPPEELSEKAYIGSIEEYERLYKESIEEPERFWARQGEENIVWFKKWDKVLEYDFLSIGETEKPYVKYFEGAKLNVSYNCLDRHLSSGRRNKAAIIWQGEKEKESRTITYQQLHTEVCKFANVLKKHGIRKGDKVTIFLPMIPELPIAMLACARIGAVHSVVFSAFSSEALATRVIDSNSKLIITTDVGFHGGRVIELKRKVDYAIKECSCVRKVIVYNYGNMKVDMTPGRDFWWHEEMIAEDIKAICEPEEMDAEDPLFILYTSGTTGKPKGVVHTTAGYLLHVHLSFKWVFDVKDEDIFWCTADIGWVTGHSYIVYGPLSNGATSLMYEGTPTYPKPDRFWKIIDDYKVNIFYTAPTAIRTLMRLGDEWPNKHDLSSIRILGTVGEPINPEAWLWYHRVIGKERCVIVDTWWQTESGGILITPLPGAIPTKPGSASKPFFGVVPEVLRDDGTNADVNEEGILVINRPWLGMFRWMQGDHKNQLVKEIYFSMYPGKYFTGDACKIDQDGFYWLMGRTDDVLNVSGHRLSTAEVESALVSHKSVAESAVVGVPHEVKGQGIYCYVSLKKEYEPSDMLRRELITHVRQVISPIATPDKIHFADALPKTRSGKIMRRILRKIASGKIDEVGDITTLADPSVVESLIKTRV